MQIWRLSLRDTVLGAFNGDGAKKYGGRWNKKGTPIVYASSTISLCALEVLVHADSDLMPEQYAYSIEVPDPLLIVTPKTNLPSDWKRTPGPEALQELGSSWVDSLTSVILGVPSAIVPSEWNYLINPNHRDFSQLTIKRDHLFSFDSRLQRN